ncbi:hypothetical protein [Actinokineospora enzanensis]|uniref:hypothetical protein n=1 Tax=Actinokineospora enzanensis TaxID=155975 RepID=UPI0003AA18E1|nr:hypothetical protein [Actinokineospora enzanensis]
MGILKSTLRAVSPAAVAERGKQRQERVDGTRCTARPYGRPCQRKRFRGTETCGDPVCAAWVLAD